MRKPPPPRLPRTTLVRGRRTAPKNAIIFSVPQKRDWVGLFGTLTSTITAVVALFVAVVVAGTGNIRDIPKIPSVLRETLSKASARWTLDRQLTGKWYGRAAGDGKDTPPLLLIEMQTDEGKSGGMMTSRASIPWHLTQYTDFVGEDHGEYLKLEFWSFIGGERVTLAKARVRIGPVGPEDCPTICEGKPDVDFDHLEMHIDWQAKNSLPADLILVRQ